MVTVAAVAEEADVAQTTFYAHFDSREAFLDAVRLRTVQRFRVLTNSMVEADKPAEVRLAAFVRTVMLASMTHRDGVRYWLSVGSNGRTHDGEFYSLMREIIADGAEIGTFTTVRDAELSMRMFVGAVLSALRVEVGREADGDTGDWAAVASQCLRLLGVPADRVIETIEGLR